MSAFPLRPFLIQAPIVRCGGHCPGSAVVDRVAAWPWTEASHRSPRLPFRKGERVGWFVERALGGMKKPAPSRDGWYVVIMQRSLRGRNSLPCRDCHHGPGFDTAPEGSGSWQA
jgi:hypothetical protein